MLPGYSFMLGLLALLGFFAIAAGVDKLPEFAAGFKQFGNNFAVPALFLHSFPSWFVGVAFAAIGIGALVPAAIMSIAAANLYTRNIHREFINRNPTDKQEAQMAKWVSLIVKARARWSSSCSCRRKYAIQLQLLGGIWIIQTLPAVMLGAYTRWFNRWALLVGWAVGMLRRHGDGGGGQPDAGLSAGVGGPQISRLHGLLYSAAQSRCRGNPDAGVPGAKSGAAGRRDNSGRLPGLNGSKPPAPCELPRARTPGLGAPPLAYAGHGP